MSKLKNLFSPMWIQWRVVHNKDEAHEIQSLFEQHGIRYKLSVYTSEFSSLSSAHQFTNKRDAKTTASLGFRNSAHVAMNEMASKSDAGNFIFKVHRADIKRASELYSHSRLPDRELK